MVSTPSQSRLDPAHESMEAASQNVPDPRPMSPDGPRLPRRRLYQALGAGVVALGGITGGGVEVSNLSYNRGYEAGAQAAAIGGGFPPPVSSVNQVAEEVAENLKPLLGEWEAKAGPNEEVKVWMKIHVDARVTSKVTNAEGREFEIQGKVRLGQKGDVKTLDWLEFKRPDGNGNFEDNHAIYRLDGDTLEICSGGPGNERPTEFKAGEGGRPSLLKFTKKTAEKPKAEEAKKK